MPSSSFRVAALAALAVTPLCVALWDEPAPQPNGPFQRTHRCHAITGADVIVRPGKRVDNATIVIRNGIIEAIGTDVAIPDDARLWPCDEMVIHAGFIEPTKMIDVEHDAQAGTHWNKNIHPELNLAQTLNAGLADADAKALRKAGYCVAAMHPATGILRGTGTVSTTDDAARDRRQYAADLPHNASFDRGGWGGGGPGSQMGAIALARQVLMDARWHAAATAAAERNALESPARRDDLDALLSASLGEQPMLFETNDVKEAMRVGSLAQELGLDVWILGSGTEYRDLAGVQSLDAPIITPVKFPDRPKLDTINAAQRIPLRTMQAWEQAPTNLRRLRDAGIAPLVTTHGLSKPNDVYGALQQAIKAGLTPDEALAAVTTAPAALLGLQDRCGTIEVGQAAHLVVRSDDPFAHDSKIQTVWVSGRPTVYEQATLATLKGSGLLLIGGHMASADIDTSKKSLNLTLADDTKVKAKGFDLTGHQLTATIDGRALGQQQWVRLAAVITDDGLIGRAVLPDGTTLPLTFGLLPEDETDTDAKADATVKEDVKIAEADTTPPDPISGTWNGQLEIPDADFSPPVILVLEREGESITGTIEVMASVMPLADATWNPNDGSLHFTQTMQGGMEAKIDVVIEGDSMSGTATGPMGEVALEASRETQANTGVVAGERSDDEDDIRFTGIPEAIGFPLGARGRMTHAKQQHTRIEHATLWTCGPSGLIEDGCLIVRNGKLAYVGPTHAAPGRDDEVVIDATGMHISPGLIDCHSHTGISGGVNEFSSACTAHVGIGDVVAADDMNWYRQLAGGLTAANQLHGSANPIGGRNSVVKLRWGQPARAFSVHNAPKGIKFALGENVKRSSGRYPDTRMGVESFIRDRFAAAEHYTQTWDRWNNLSEEAQLTERPPRWDARLETLAEIIAGDRLIHCHSYRQDEILALLRTCEDYGIRIGTLQHILEGYKVADAIADHGAGASSFSDWWAYKVEVMDAIPWNGSIMHDVGVVVSFNSDDSELATRMNDEAAKAVRYGGVEPMEALKFVCLNPAKQLGIDRYTGSLETGKDADFAMWSHAPLNSYARCEQTWIDGAPYFTRTQDAAMAHRDRLDRTRLVELILSERLGKPPERPSADADEPVPAWAAATNPYAEIHDHRGCCGVDTQDHVHLETH